MFGQGGKLLESPVHHTLKAVRQMVAVASVNDHAFHAFSVEPAINWAAAMIDAGFFNLSKKLLLQLARAL